MDFLMHVSTLVQNRVGGIRAGNCLLFYLLWAAWTWLQFEKLLGF